MRKIIYNKEAKDKLVEGIDMVANTVKLTLGPSGRNVVIGKANGFPISTKDGVSVAKEIRTNKLDINIGCELIKQVANQQLKSSGDGTTTATVLAQYLIKEGMKLDEYSPRDIKEHFRNALDDIIRTIESKSKKLVTDEELEAVSIISTNGDAELGLIVSEAVKIAGKDGNVVVENSKNSETKVVSYPGYMFERGYLSHHFAGNNSEVNLEDVRILLCDDEITSWDDIKGVVQEVHSLRDTLLIVCKDMSESALRNLIYNAQQGKLRSCVVKLPALKTRGEILLEDIAIKTGGTVVSPKNKGHAFSKVSVKHLGKADTVNIDKDRTVIIDGKGSPEAIKEREGQIRIDLEKANELERFVQEERLAKYIGGVSVIHVGANSEVELREKKDKIDDAMRATMEAMKHGIVPGGGQVLAKISTDKSEGIMNQIEAVVYESLMKPLQTIAENCHTSVKLYKDDNIVFDYSKNCEVDFLEGGIIDPTSVVKNAVINAVSLAALVLSTDALVFPEELDMEEAIMQGIEAGKNRF